MNKIVKILGSFIISLLVFSGVYATYTSTSGGYNTPILDEGLDFYASLDNGKVYMNWAKYNHSDDFKYYKVIRSQEVKEPVYPDNGYIKYSSDINFLEYIDTKPLVGDTYYRVCAITQEKNRYCSNVIKVVFKGENFVGGDRDNHGCIGSAGYQWCEVKNKCIRPWEEKCVENIVFKGPKYYRDIFKNKLGAKLKKISENKLNKVLEKIKVLKTKYKSGSIKYNQLAGLMLLIEDELSSRGFDFDEINDLFN